MRALALLLLSLVLLSGCIRNGAEEHAEKISSAPGFYNPAPEDILKQDPQADIFKFDGVTFRKAVNRDDLAQYKPGRRLGQIEKHYTPGKPFLNWTATHLPIGTDIYDTDPKSGPVLIVIQGDRIIYYVGLIEG